MRNVPEVRSVTFFLEPRDACFFNAPPVCLRIKWSARVSNNVTNYWSLSSNWRAHSTLNKRNGEWFNANVTSAETAKIRGTVKTEFSVMFGLLTVGEKIKIAIRLNFLLYATKYLKVCVACYLGSPSCEHIILHSMLSAVGCLPKWVQCVSCAICFTDCRITNKL